MSHPVTVARKPDCMDDETFGEWAAKNRGLALADQVDSPCHDCLPAFALEMQEEDRCYLDGVIGVPAGITDDPEPATRHTSPERVAAMLERSIAREEEAIALRERGMSYDDIAAELGVSRNVAYRRVYFGHQRRGTWTDERTNKEAQKAMKQERLVLAAALHATGWPLSAIAKEMGIHKGTVSKYVKEAREAA